MTLHVQGSCHQGDMMFEGRGRQCTAMAMRSLAHHKVKHVHAWTTQDMDQILQHGDMLFMEASRFHDVTLLLPSEAVKTICIDDVIVTLTTGEEVTGLLSENGHMSTHSHNNETTLSQAFGSITDMAVLTFGSVFSSYTLGVIRDCNAFYLFDSHSRDDVGLSVADGCACVTKHESTCDLVKFIERLSLSLGIPNDSMFEVSCVSATVEKERIGYDKSQCQIIPDSLHRSQTIDSDGDDNIPLIQICRSKNQVAMSMATLQGGSEIEDSDDDIPLSRVREQLSSNHYEGESDHSLELGNSRDGDCIPSEGDLKIMEENPSITHSADEDCIMNALQPAAARQSDINTGSSLGIECQLGPKGPSVTENDVSNSTNDISSFSTNVGNSTVTSPALSPHSQVRRSRKRVRNIDEWKISKRQRLRNTGKPYVTRTGKLNKGRVLKPGCGNSCRNKCKSKITEEDREKVFHSFWNSGCLTKQRDYLCSVVRKTVKKTAKVKSTISRRSATYEYTLKLEDQSIKVCKKMFLDTLDISESVVFTALGKMTCLGTCADDERGSHKNRGNPEEKERIKHHINSFPRVESHYARKDSKRQYLESSLSLKRMFNMYLEEREKEGVKDPISESTYRNVFNYEFNIGFFKRMKDRCDVCAGYDNSKDQSQETQSDEKYKEHIAMKEDSRKYKDAIKNRLKEDSSLTAAVFDLEEVLPSPSSVESCLYYKRKLNTFNLTVYDYRNGQGFCNIWNETQGKRGSNEIASCIYSYLQQVSKEGIKKIILFSDSCGGQNRNRNMLSMMWFALQKLQFEEIEHVFFVTGHSQNEGDSMHSTIERCSRNVPVYTPSQWAQLIRTAKRTPPLYIVKELDRRDFFNFKNVAVMLHNFELDTNKDKIKWLKVKRFQIKANNPNIVNVYYDYSDDCQKLNLIQKFRQKQSVPNPSAIQLENVAHKLYPISKDKYADLVSLCEKNIIPRPHQQYFQSLPHEN